jgi:hypothetical protein
MLICYRNLIRRGCSIWCGGKAYTMACRVIYRIEAFKKCIAVNEVKALPCGRSEICYDEIDIATRASNKGIE